MVNKSQEDKKFTTMEKIQLGVNIALIITNIILITVTIVSKILVH